MLVRELLAKFGLDFDAKSFKKADQSINDLKAQATKLVTTLIALDIGRRLAHVVEATLDMADETGKAAAKIGLTTEKLQELRFAGDLAGVSAQELDRAMTLLTKKAGDAGIGNAEAAKSFAQIGISVRDAHGKIKPTDQLMEQIADRMKGATSATERLRIATEFFGTKGGGKFVAMLKDGSEGLRAAQQEARELGGIFSGEFAEKAEIFNDNLTRLKFGLRGIGLTILNSLLPYLLDLSETMIKWVRANRDLIKQRLDVYVKRFAEGVKSAARILGAMWKIVSAIVRTLGGFETAMKMVAAAIGINFVASIGQAVLAMGALTARMLLTKAALLADAFLIGAAFLLLAGIIALIVEEIEAIFDDKVDGLFEKMRGKWGDLKESILADVSEDDWWLTKLLKFAGVMVTDVFDKLDRGFAFFFDKLLALKENLTLGFINNLADTYQKTGTQRRDAYVNWQAWQASQGITPSTGAMSMSPSSPAVTNNVDVSIDASGQSLNEDQVSSIVSRGVENAITNANAIALQSLTPSLAE